MSLCSCTNVYGNTGQTNCKTVFGVARDFWFAPLFDSSDAKTKILASATLDQSFFITRFNENDRNDRLYPVKNVEQLDPAKADTKFFDFDSGTKQRLAEGVRTFTFFLPDVELALLET